MYHLTGDPIPTDAETGLLPEMPPLPEPVTDVAPKGRPFLTRSEFVEAWARMKRGRSMVYHVGFLMHDRFLAIHAKAIHAVGKYAWNLSYEGVAELSQERLSPGVYRYKIYKRLVQ